MNTYLTIMVTILIATQIIRITQNAINLHRQKNEIKKQIGWIQDTYPTDEDFKNQHECYRMLREWLEWKVEELEREYTEQLDSDDDAQEDEIESRKFDISDCSTRTVKCIDKYDTSPYSCDYELLEIGKEYTVTDVLVFYYYTMITLKEFPGKKFNSVLFAESKKDDGSEGGLISEG